jgi:hypothetical protein
MKKYSIKWKARAMGLTHTSTIKGVNKEDAIDSYMMGFKGIILSIVEVDEQYESDFDSVMFDSNGRRRF